MGFSCATTVMEVINVDCMMTVSSTHTSGLLVDTVLPAVSHFQGCLFGCYYVENHDIIAEHLRALIVADSGVIVAPAFVRRQDFSGAN
jgi:hypothetical protein